MHPVAAAGGVKIVFDDSQGQISTVNPDGTGYRQLGIHGFMPSVSPDGTKIVYHAGGLVPHRNNQDLYVANIDGTNAVDITPQDIDIDWFAIWSPDGSKILFQGDFNLNFGLYTIAPDGSNLQYVAPGMEYGSFSPDGTRIVFTRAGSIGVANVDGTNVTMFSSDDLGIPFSTYRPPRWSPDGTRIVFSGLAANPTPNHGRSIYAMNPDGTDVTTLLDNVPGLDFMPWSPDSSLIAFNSTFDGISGIYAIPRTGGTPQFIFSLGTNGISPFAWTFVADLSGDTVPPTVTGLADRPANGAGWYNAPVTITWSADDPSPSSGTPTTPPPTLVDSEGANQTITSDPSCDPAGNCATGSVTISIDKTAPTLNVPVWSANPKPTTSSTTLTIPATDSLSGITNAEYFIGTTDPGQGSGTAMTLSNQQTNGSGAVTSSDLTTSFGTNFQPGVYKISVRAQDAAGNWSAPVSDYLVVFDPSGPTDVAASKKAAPLLANGDILPGLVSDTQNDKANLGFDVFLNTNGTPNSLSKLSLDYATGQACNSPHPSNCHTTNFVVTTTTPNAINWLSISGANGSTGTFQGQGTLTIDGTTTTNPFKVVATDGDRTTPVSSDDVVLQIFAPGADPATAPALYQLHIQAAGNWVKVQ